MTVTLGSDPLEAAKRLPRRAATRCPPTCIDAEREAKIQAAVQTHCLECEHVVDDVPLGIATACDLLLCTCGSKAPSPGLFRQSVLIGGKCPAGKFSVTQ